ncbi:MAG: hypothetical protein NWR87_03340 [Rhodospirillales bacterium]|nr:hypothetical protein [Rhodospirillales bacterium]
MAKTFRDISIGIFFLVLSGMIVIGGPKLFDEWKEAHSQRLEAQKQLVGVLNTSIEGVLAEVGNVRKLEADHFEQMKLKAENTYQFMEEISILAGVRFLEDGRIVSPSTADEMAREAIQNIRTKYSERIGKILEAANDAYLRKRR